MPLTEHTAWHEMCCPQCGKAKHLGVSAEIWVDLVEDGTVESEQFDASHTWGDYSPCMCGGCGWEGLVEEAKTACRSKAQKGTAND